jgi:hypothetical protein
VLNRVAEVKKVFFDFENFSIRKKSTIAKSPKVVSSISRSSDFSAQKSMRTAKSWLNLLEGRARRRCFRSVARYPLPWLLLPRG